MHHEYGRQEVPDYGAVTIPSHERASVFRNERFVERVDCRNCVGTARLAEEEKGGTGLGPSPGVQWGEERGGGSLAQQ